MLHDLEIQDLGIIRQASLELGPGLNVLTGETGAGKTMLVSALGWLLGGRADRDRVRRGATVSVVQARIDDTVGVAAEWSEGEPHLIVHREVAAKDAPATRSKVRLAGRLAPVSSLAEVMAPLVEIHGQHESMRLSEERVQRRLLDRFGADAVAGPAGRYRTAYDTWRATEAELAAAERTQREGAREADILRMELEEIDAVAPEEDEEAELDALIRRLDHAEGLRLAAERAVEALLDDGGGRDQIGSALAELQHQAAHDEELVGYVARLDGALAEVQEVAIDLRGYLEGIEADPDALQAALARRASIGRLLRKYGADTTQVLVYAADARARLALIEGGKEAIERLRAAAEAARTALDKAGGELRDARTAAAVRLSADIDHHLAALSMQEARTTIGVEAAEPGPDGADSISMLLAANRGQPALPLGRAASGGERSRVALAVKVALADADDIGVLVFDEVDAGIGGEVALQVGRKLAKLAADGRQVLCVTHLAQIAAFADHQFVVSKTAEGDDTTTTVVQVTGAQREREVARMLAGGDGDEALAAARALIAEATAPSP